MKGAEDIRNKYYEALVRISALDPGLWQTMQDIANETLGKKPRWRGKKKTPQCSKQVCYCGNKGVCLKQYPWKEEEDDHS